MNINIDPQLVRTFGLYGGLLAGKMLVMSPLTARQRMKKKVFLNPEDAKVGEGKVDFNDDDVERIRRAHLNDMENIYLFFASSGLYLLTEPDVGTATNLIRIFTAARYLHTIAYLNEAKPQVRGFCFMAGTAVQAYMIFKTVKYFLKCL